ncbi:HlyC/CorC family transporter [Phreatobacter sp. AB_2022a]|uniref:HlyC/CorC family transporter n=1 Tax=Phreatobacter sp. AB_2022a TaxID=3003134 RepID=UPI0022872CF7|nr:HlyC/CorC family transporter [Phreatobacter sp. AB_2022a]MCZ0735013.1 HlyC/CorC family transporter [Phreatobacter sp. AB_2022a]
MDDVIINPWAALAIIVVSLMLSAFFSAGETAMSATSKARMLALETAGDSRARLINRMLDARERLIGAMLVGNNIVNIAVSAFTTSLMVGFFGAEGVIYATFIMSVLIIVFAEVLPKTVAIVRPERVSLAIARPVSVVVAVLGPVLLAIEAVVRGVLRPFGLKIDQNQNVLTGAEELRGTVDLMHKEGAFEKLDRDMVGGILDLKDLSVSDVMVHRTKMVTIDVGDTPDQVVRDVLAAPYTRIPLWRDTPENIIGVLHGKDLLRALAAAGGDVSKIDLTSLALPAWFVPDSTSLQDQLKAFLRRKTHFALVVDEYGEVMGLVTLEDIIEEIVGDIKDEHDVQMVGVRPQADGSVNVDGSVPIRDLNRAMDWRLPDEEATTIAGLVIHEARSIPETGQTFTFHGFRFHVLRKQRNRITALKITPLERLV